MSILFQSFCTAIVCYVSMSMGIVFAWPSGTLTLFSSPNTTLHRPMGETERALFGSLSSVGALISTPIAGYCLDAIGRKFSAVLTALTYVIAWGLIASTTQVEMILVAVFIAGLGSAAMLVVRIYVSEICEERVRGAMTTGAMVFYSLGLLLSYAMGDTMDYKVMVYACLALSVLGVLLLALLKESPTYLMSKGLEQEAAQSIAFYRRVSPDSKEVLQEMDALRRAFNPDFENVSDPHEIEKLTQEDIKEIKPAKKLSLWKFLKNSRSTRKATSLTLVLMTASTFQGLVVLQVYAKPLFEEAVPGVPSTLCTVLQAVVTIFAGLASGYLCDLAGRRPLIIWSSLAAGACCLVLGTQLQLHWGPHWVTAGSLYFFTLTYTFGAGTVPFVLVIDVFLPEVKSMMSMVVTQWCWLCCFIILFLFNPLVGWVGLGPVFYVFASVCVLTAVYSAAFLPETKGVSLDAVQLLLTKTTHDK